MSSRSRNIPSFFHLQIWYMNDASTHYQSINRAVQDRRQGRSVSIVVADELAMMRDGLAAICDSTEPYEVVAQGSDGAEAVELIERLHPDLAALDLQLPKLHTLEVIRKVRRSSPGTRIVVLSMRGDKRSVIEALRSGASGFVLKGCPAWHLFEAFQQVLDGGIYISPMLEVREIFGTAREGDPDPLQNLSAREHQVFSLLVEGLRAKEVAARLELSPKTVDTYRANLMRKLDIHDVAGLVKFAITRNMTAR